MKSSIHTKWTVFMMTLLMAVCGATPSAQAAVSISEDFNDLALDGNLEDATVVYDYALANASLIAGNAYRAYIRTTTTDYNTTDLTYEVSFTMAAGNHAGYEMVFFGIGMADRDATYYDVPTSAYYLQIWEGGFALNSGETAGAPTQILSKTASLLTRDTEHRLRLSLNGTTVIWEIDANYTGTFAADYSVSSSLAADAPFLDNTNSRLFFGAGANYSTVGLTSFDDVEIVAGSSSAPVAVSINEDFNLLALDQDHVNLEDNDVLYVFDQANARLIYGGYGYRGYIRTTTTAYNMTNFAYEISFTMAAGTGGDGGWEQAYFGIGMADRDETYFNVPTSAYYLQAWDAGFGLYSNIGEEDPNITPIEIVRNDDAPLLTRDTEHRLRMTLAGTTLTWEIDAGFTGTFSADYSMARSLPADAPFIDNTNARLFFGAGANWYTTGGLTSFDDLEIAVAAECTTEIASDLDGDCYVDLVDFGIFAGDWLRCSHPDDVDCE